MFPLLEIETLLIESDPDKMLKGDFVVEITEGAEILKRNSLVSRHGDLKVGDDIVAFGIFNEKIPMKVTSIDGNKGVAENEHTLADLEFGTDFRKIWFCRGLTNKRAIEELAKFIF